MNVTAFLLFDKLSGCMPVSVLSGAHNCEITQICVYNGQLSHLHTLYLLDASTWKPPTDTPASCAILLFRFDTLPQLPRPPAYCAAACVAESTEALLETCTNELLRLNHWSSQLSEARLNSEPLMAALPLMRQLMGMPFMLIERNFHPLYISPDWPEEHPAILCEKTASAAIHDPLFLQNISRPALFLSAFPGAAGQYYCCSLRGGAAILVAPEWVGASPQVKRYLLQTAADQLGELLPHFRASALIRLQNDAIHSMFRSMLLKPNCYTTTDVEQVLKGYGWTLHQEYTVVEVCFPLGSGGRESVEYLCMRLETLSKNSCAVCGREGIVWVFNHGTPNDIPSHDALSAILNEATHQFHCRAGVSYSFSGFWNFDACYQQAHAALSLGQKADPKQRVYFFSDYMLDFTFQRLIDGYFLPYMYHPAILSMADYDVRHRTDYFRTLLCYAAYAGNVSQASEALYIHRTTLIRRLERICELSGRDITSREDLFLLQFSYHIINRIHKTCTAEEMMQELERTAPHSSERSSAPAGT